MRAMERHFKCAYLSGFNRQTVNVCRFCSKTTLNEDEPPKQRRVVHNLRNARTIRAVYAAGLSSTGSLGVENLIMNRTAPETIFKPIRVPSMNMKKIRKVSAGFGFSLFASSTVLYGSGINNFYQIGGPRRTADNDKSNALWYITPRRILLPEDCGNIIDISSGRLHSLIATKKALYSLGDNSHGQCGLNPDKFLTVTCDKQQKWKAVEIPDHSPIRNVHCCLDTSFVLLENGELYSFGLGTDGQLGNGNEEFQWTPMLVEGDLKGEKISRISGSTDTLIALSTNGDLFAWGQNEYGQMAVITDEPQVLLPRQLPFNLPGKLFSAAATGSSCIVCNEDGEVFTWGSMVLGFGPKVEHLTRPMQLDAPLFSSSANDDGKVYAGNVTMGAVTEPGHLFTWGSNRNGALGVGHPNHQYFPYQVFLSNSIKHASFGPDHTLFLTH